MDPVLYGLANCDTCKKALNWLKRAGIACRFIDYKQQPIAGDLLKTWSARLGWDRLINRSGTTWRGLPPNRKSPGSDAEYVLLVREYPSLVRRPVLVLGDRLEVGFTHSLYEQIFAAKPE